MISEDVIKKVLASVNIVDIIRNYLPLQKKGKSFTCICPFHDDHSPSLSISEQKQIFKCFTCGTGGNAIQFVQQYEHLTFTNAVKKVAELGNVKIDIETNKIEIPKERLLAYQINKELANYATNELHSDSGKKAYNYLKHRGITSESIQRFSIGYIPDKVHLKKFLLTKGFDESQLMQHDIFDYNENCKWEKRIVFPITDDRDNIYGFTSRYLENDGSPKYMNTRETPIFQKNRLFYHCDETYPKVRHEKEIILMEGSTDVIWTNQIGIKNCVATLGTALTSEHVEMLKKMNVRVNLCYDGDLPGRQATEAAYHLLIKSGIEPTITILPEGKDPAELIQQNPEAFKTLIKKNHNFFDFKLITAEPLVLFQEKELFILDFMKELQLVNDPIKSDYYLNALSSKVSISFASLNEKYKMLTETSKQLYKAQKVVKKAPKTDLTKTAKKVLINFKEKDKLIYKNEMKANYDRLQDSGNVIAFDHHKVLDRVGVLEKYIHLKGRVLETTITCMNELNLPYKAQSICSQALESIGETNNIPYENLEYVAYLHQDTKFPHIHLQVWQHEPYLDKYSLTTELVNQLQKKVLEGLNNPEFPKNQQVLDPNIEEINASEISISKL